jgi:DNA repair protein RecN (Recombination protein N)
MIAELSVSHLAIIEKTTLRLERGLTVLTGETGAGKSLLIDAIQLALGERADSDLVREGAKSASVSVAFDLSGYPEIVQLCEELGVPLEDSVLFVTRELFAEGRSQCRLSGRLMPATVLRQLGDALVDLHGQHDHQSLLHQDRHVDYLDLWIGLEAHALRNSVKEAFTAYSAAKRKLEAMRADIQQRERKLDLLRFQIEEVEAVSPQLGEYEELQTTLSRLQNLERLMHAAQISREAISESEGSALELTGVALKSLEEARRYDPALGAMADQLSEIVFSLEDLASALTKFADALETSPDALDATSNRLEALRKLRRKYGEDESTILESLAEAKLQLANLEDGQSNEATLEKQAKELEQELMLACRSLSELRKSRSRPFSEEIEIQLQDLALSNARFGVGVKPTEPTATGSDDVEFVFSANPGEPLRPLQRVASGGEVSRLMLAMKTVLAGKAGVPTLIFDEIDSGMGGRVGAIVGKKLADLAELYQVLVISHLPQVAALANHHFRIEKTELSDRTATTVRRLDPDQRLQEIARMLAGEQITETALAHARELLGFKHSPNLFS